MKIEYSKEKLENVVINSNTYRQVLLAFNRNQCRFQATKGVV